MCIYNWVIIIWTTVMFVLSDKLYGEKWNPCNLMNIIWCACSTFSVLELYDLYVPSSNTFKIILIFLIVFSISSIICHVVLNIKNSNLKGLIFPSENKTFNRLYLMYFALCLIKKSSEV